MVDDTSVLFICLIELKLRNMHHELMTAGCGFFRVIVHVLQMDKLQLDLNYLLMSL
jgi:hypothetical protein